MKREATGKVLEAIQAVSKAAYISATPSTHAGTKTGQRHWRPADRHRRLKRSRTRSVSIAGAWLQHAPDFEQMNVGFKTVMPIVPALRKSSTWPILMNSFFMRSGGTRASNLVNTSAGKMM